MMSKDFDRGLALLKDICEKEFKTISSFGIKMSFSLLAVLPLLKKKYDSMK